MGLAARAEIASALMDRGWAGATPAALLVAAGTPRATTWVGRLDGLGEAPAPAPGGAPGVIVVGEVAALARPEVAAVAAMALASS